ncbi:MAG: TonB-dependent receptor [Rhodothermaceae bacterium]|nr:TonB-dependent receptor [Rhodothermaceae bacterium]
MQSPFMCFGIVWKHAETLLATLPIKSLTVLIWCFAFFATNVLAQQRFAEVNGLVTDALNGQPLEGATVFLKQPGVVGIIDGSSTNRTGQYRLSQILPGQYELIIRYVGFDEERLFVDVDAGELKNIDASLEQNRIHLNTVVVSASRQEEKILDAISSVSVLSDHNIQSETSLSPASSLRYIAGVDHAQTGIDRREISLRGFNNSVTGETYILSDHRLSTIPGLAVNAYGLMPIPTLDVSRIEVVRGPGSALYGSGVDQGLIHFITKDPFSYPGTSISTGGGERGVFETEFRHAGTYNQNWGYKIVGEYASGDDWELNRGNEEDLDIIRVNGDTLRDNSYWKYGLNGLVEYRFNQQTKVIANGGYLSQKMALLTGIGAAQTDNFSYLYGQVRFESGPFFSQVYVNQNDGGSSFYYNPTTISGSRFNIVDQTVLVNGQMQYDLNLFDGREEFLAGADYKLTIPKTEGTIHGRNEEKDRIEEFGAYAQSTTILTEDVTLTLALRGDYNNLFEQFQLSPRAGITFKITPSHTFKVAANQAFGAPVLNPNFLDIPIANEVINGPFGFTLQGRGAYDGFSFNQYRESGQIRYLLPDLGDLQQPDSPAFFGQMVPLDQLPIHPVYESFASQITQLLLNGDPVNEQLNTLSLSERQRFASLVNQLVPFVQGETSGTLGIPGLDGAAFRPVNSPVDIAPLEQTRTSSIEIGYNGVIGRRFIVSADAYVTQKKNFIGPLALESPYVYMSALEEDLTNLLSPILGDFINADPELASFLQSMNLQNAEQTAAFLATLISDGPEQLPAYSNTRVGVVSPDQQILPDGTPANIAGGLFSYRNFGNVTLWGTDLAVEYIASEKLRMHAHMSYISDDYFDNTELQEEGSELAVALNAPTFKMGMGAEYQFPFGLSLRASGRAVNEFIVITGPFEGMVDDYVVFDAGVGYDFGRQITGLRIDLTAQNLLTFVNGKSVSTHREFVGAPQIGRIVMARALFTF